jgi:hypothetical protein
MRASLDTQRSHGTGGVGGQGIMAPTPEQIKDAIEQQMAKGLRGLNPANRHDAKLIAAFKALPKDEKYNVTKPGEEDDTNVAGIVGRNRTVVVQTIGFAGFPVYETAGKLQIEW